MNGNSRIRGNAAGPGQGPVMPSPRRLVPGGIPIYYPGRSTVIQKVDHSEASKKHEGSGSHENSKRQPNDDRRSPSGLVNTPGLNGSFRILSSDFFIQKDSVSAERRDNVSRG